MSCATQAARHKNGDYVTVTERQCTKCFEVKAYTQFHRKASGPGGLQPHCITCMKVRVDVATDLRILASPEFPGQQFKCDHSSGGMPLFGRQISWESDLVARQGGASPCSRHSGCGDALTAARLAAQAPLSARLVDAAGWCRAHFDPFTAHSLWAFCHRVLDEQLLHDHAAPPRMFHQATGPVHNMWACKSARFGAYACQVSYTVELSDVVHSRQLRRLRKPKSALLIVLYEIRRLGAGVQEERPTKRAKVEGPVMRVCVHCQQEKKIAQFSRDPGGPDGRQTWCMLCMKVRRCTPCVQKLRLTVNHVQRFQARTFRDGLLHTTAQTGVQSMWALGYSSDQVQGPCNGSDCHCVTMKLSSLQMHK